MGIKLGTACSALGCNKDAEYWGVHKRCEHVSFLCWEHMGNAKRDMVDRTKIAFCWECGAIYDAHETYRRRTEFAIYPIERLSR